jgi:hypothetical protein
MCEAAFIQTLLSDGCELRTVNREDEKMLLSLEMKLTLKNTGCFT